MRGLSSMDEEGNMDGGTDQETTLLNFSSNIEQSKATFTQSLLTQQSPPALNKVNAPETTQQVAEAVVAEAVVKQEQHSDFEAETEENGVDLAAVNAEVIAQINHQVQEMMSRVLRDGENFWQCSVCGKEDKAKTIISHHVEGKHIGGTVSILSF